jgi:hypothetical protein
MLSAPMDPGHVARRLAVASPAGFKPTPRSRTRWTLPVLTIATGASTRGQKSKPGEQELHLISERSQVAEPPYV